MSNQLFSIRPLKWEKSFNNYQQYFTADVPMGTYRVERIRENCDEYKPWQTWRLIWCFDEYYDEGYREVESAKAGKDAAWADWLNRITPALKAEGRAK